jgi:hypothetical protein
MCSLITFNVSWRTWLSVLELIRPMCPVPAPGTVGKPLLEYDNVEPLVAGVDLDEFKGSVVGVDSISDVCAVLLVSAEGNGGGVACSLTLSAKGVSGCFGVDNDVLGAPVLGASRVYTVKCQLAKVVPLARRSKHTLWKETTVAVG